MNRILDAIKDRNLEPALEWARANREALNLRGTTLKFSKAGVLQKSSLELRLHKLKFVELLRAGSKLAAITYARQNFPAFVEGQEREVQGLMCAVMYAGPGLADSPYGHLLDPSHWTDIGDLFLRDACALLGLSVESPLAVAVNAGCVALPALLKCLCHEHWSFSLPWKPASGQTPGRPQKELHILRESQPECHCG